MPRPSLPKAEDLAKIYRLLKAEGCTRLDIETLPDGRVMIRAGEDKSSGKVSPLEEWRRGRETS